MSVFGQFARTSALFGSVAVIAFAANAQAQGVPVVPGVTVYGTIDVGVGYQSDGQPTSGSFGQLYQPLTTTRGFTGSQTGLIENALEFSKIGVRLDEAITKDINVVAQAEAGIVPLSGELMNSCKTLAQNGGVGTPANPSGQNANLDTALCGQAFSRGLWGGVASKTYGTLTAGRQNSPALTLTAGYDPQGLAPGFSFLGWSGTVGGSGSTEGSRWNNSVRYVWTGKRFHVAAEYAAAAFDEGAPKDSWGVTAGFTAGGFTVDALYQRENSVVSLRSSLDNAVNPLSNPTPISTKVGTPTVGLSAYLSQNSQVLVAAKYTTTLKNKATLTFFAAYTHYEKAHVDAPGNSLAGFAQGGYPVSFDLNVNQTAKYDFEWAGVRYTTAKKLTVSLGFYHADQSDWTVGLGTTGTQNIGCTPKGLLCAGSFNEASLLVVKPVIKHVDLYAGINWANVTKGLAWGFRNNQGGGGVGTQGSEDQTNILAGVRIKF